MSLSSLSFPSVFSVFVLGWLCYVKWEVHGVFLSFLCVVWSRARRRSVPSVVSYMVPLTRYISSGHHQYRGAFWWCSKGLQFCVGGICTCGLRPSLPRFQPWENRAWWWSRFKEPPSLCIIFTSCLFLPPIYAFFFIFIFVNELNSS